MFRRKSALRKFWLKLSNRAAYKQYNWELTNYSEQEALNFFTGNNRLDTRGKIISAAKAGNQLHITHGGNAGDVIYALPTIKKIQELTGVPINLYLRINMPLPKPKWSDKEHSMGSVRINNITASMLMPLLNAQSYIAKCEIYENQKIQIDLDFFRSKSIVLHNANIARWCSYITGITPDLWKPWLNVVPNAAFKDKIILARSERYLNSTIDYSFLKKYNNICFIGVKSEYDTMKRILKNLEWVQVENFLQLAVIIAGCKFFIGNQSFPYSIAEGLKVPRILEAYYHAPDVIPEGENAHDFYYQNHFESLVQQLNEDIK